MSLTLQAAGCAPVRDCIDAGMERQQLAQYRQDLASGFFETVIQQSRMILRDGETEPPADAALYALGEAYVDYAYSGRDYTLSKLYFEKLIRNFPDSPLTAEARTFVGLYEAIEARDLIIAGQKRTIAGLAEQNTRAAAKKPLAPRRAVVENHDFEKALRKNQQILHESGAGPGADEALFNLGLIHAHNDNPDKNLQKSRDYFARLSREFPGSPLAEQARAWLGLFEVIEQMRRIDLEIDEQKKQQNR